MASEFHFDKSDKAALLRQVASSLSHDLRTPLRHSGQFLELYEKDMLAGKSVSAASHLEVVKESIAETFDMVTAIVGYTRLGMTLNAPVQLDLAEIAKAARERVQLENYLLKSDLQFEGDRKLFGHPQLLGDLFFELIQNAAQFAPAGQDVKISISGKQSDDQLVLLISDNGQGVPIGYEELVFDLFQKVNSDRPSKGAGIGLSTARRIAEIHGGSLRIVPKEDCPDTEGLTLELILPLRPSIAG